MTNLRQLVSLRRTIWDDDKATQNTEYKTAINLQPFAFTTNKSNDRKPCKIYNGHSLASTGSSLDVRIDVLKVTLPK